MTGNVGGYVSIAADSSNNPHIVYYDATKTDLVYGNRDVNWAFKTMDGDDSVTQDRGQYANIAINPVNGAPSAAYWDSAEGGVYFAEGMVPY